MARQPLGRGLNAILGDADAPPPVAAVPKPAESGDEAGRLGVTEVPIERVVAGRAQPRRTFDEDALDELAQSIREQGILQPLVVVRGSGGYELIAGERRLRAAQRDGAPHALHDEPQPRVLLPLHRHHLHQHTLQLRLASAAQPAASR